MDRNRALLSTPQRRRHRERLETLEIEVLECIEGLLDEIEIEPLRRQLHAVVFMENEVLPRRRHRPKLETAHLVDQLYKVYANDYEPPEALIQFSIVAAEYYDILDDLVDGDVDAGRESEILLTSQLLMPLIVRLLKRLDADATAFWTTRAIELIEAPLTELVEEPSAEVYLDIVDRQATLYGFLTGVSAITGGASRTGIDRAESIGRTYYKFEQLLIDRSQADGKWNAWELMYDADVLDKLFELQTDLERLVGDLPQRRAEQIYALAAIDLNEWNSTFGTAPND